MQTLIETKTIPLKPHPLTFFWKEWPEHRINILLTAALMFALSVGSYFIWPDLFDATQINAELSIYVNITLTTCLIAATICGSSLVAPETGRGTLQFLSSLPISRKAIWTAKILTGLLIYAACVLITYLLCCILALRTFATLKVPVTFGAVIPDITYFLWFYIGAGIATFFISSIVTLLLDKTLSTIAVSAIASIAVFALVEWISQVISFLTPDLRADFEPLLIALVIAASAYISFQVFVYGESLKTRKKYLVLLRAGLFDCGLVFAALVTFYWLVFR